MSLRKFIVHNNTTNQDVTVEADETSTPEQILALSAKPPSVGNLRYFNVRDKHGRNETVQANENATPEEILALRGKVPSAAMTEDETFYSNPVTRFGLGTLPAQAALSAAQFLPSETANRWASDVMNAKEFGMRKQSETGEAGWDLAGLAGGVLGGGGLAVGAAKLGRSVAPQVALAGRTLARPTVQGAIMGAASPLAQPDPTLSDKGKQILADTALSGAVGVGARTVGGAYNKASAYAQPFLDTLVRKDGATNIARNKLFGRHGIVGKDDLERVQKLVGEADEGLTPQTVGQIISTSKDPRLMALSELEENVAQSPFAGRANLINKYTGQENVYRESLGPGSSAEEITVLERALKQRSPEYDKAKDVPGVINVNVKELVDFVDETSRLNVKQPAWVNELKRIKGQLVTETPDSVLIARAAKDYADRTVPVTATSATNQAATKRIEDILENLKSGNVNKDAAIAKLNDVRTMRIHESTKNTVRQMVESLSRPNQKFEQSSAGLISTWSDLGETLTAGQLPAGLLQKIRMLRDDLGERIASKNPLFATVQEAERVGGAEINKLKVGRALQASLFDPETGKMDPTRFTKETSDQGVALIERLLGPRNNKATGLPLNLEDVLGAEQASSVKRVTDELVKRNQYSLKPSVRASQGSTSEEVAGTQLNFLTRAMSLANSLRKIGGKDIEPEVVENLAEMLANKTRFLSEAKKQEEIVKAIMRSQSMNYPGIVAGALTPIEERARSSYK